jgi:hypothetical protein
MFRQMVALCATLLFHLLRNTDQVTSEVPNNASKSDKAQTAALAQFFQDCSGKTRQNESY